MKQKKSLGIPASYRSITVKEYYDCYRKLQDLYLQFEYHEDDPTDLVTYPADLVKSDIKMYERRKHG